MGALNQESVALSRYGFAGLNDHLHAVFVRTRKQRAYLRLSTHDLRTSGFIAGAIFSAIELLGLLNPAQRLDGLLGFGSVGVVGVAAGVTNDAIAVDDVARRDRKRPAVVAVALGEINAELNIDLLEVVRECPSQAVGGSCLETGITEDLETEFPLLDQRPTSFRDLRRDGDEGGAG